MIRTLLAVLLVALAGCDAPQPPLRQVTIESPEALGLSLQELPSSVLRSLGLSYGLSVVKAGSLAQRAGLRVGDIVYEVNQRRLRTIEDFTRIVAEQPDGSLGLQVRRGNADFYVPVDLGAAGAPRPAEDTLLRT
jgi:S1-C subfamily serine protease